MTAINRSLVLLTMSLVLQACSTQAWYEGAKSGQRSHCLNEPGAAYQDCIEGTDTSYTEYSKQRSSVEDSSDDHSSESKSSDRDSVNTGNSQ